MIDPPETEEGRALRAAFERFERKLDELRNTGRERKAQEMLAGFWARCAIGVAQRDARRAPSGADSA